MARTLLVPFGARKKSYTKMMEWVKIILGYSARPFAQPGISATGPKSMKVA